MKLQLAGVALVALTPVLAGCGGHASSTQLKIEVANGSGIYAYQMRCGPAGGSAPNPEAICAAIRRDSNLLVGGPKLDHSCPAASVLDTVFRVSGAYRGYPIEATFTTTRCGSVPGQGGGFAEWKYLMKGATAGVPERALGSTPVSRAEREQRRRLERRFDRLVTRDRRLTLERAAAWRDGRLRIRAGAVPDPRARTVLRDYAVGQTLAGGLLVYEARVYSAVRSKVERVLGFRTFGQDVPVYVLFVRYAYRDYTGRTHRADESTCEVFDARTLVESDVCYGVGEELRRLGRPVALRL